jgi:hypothetical protein
MPDLFANLPGTSLSRSRQPKNVACWRQARLGCSHLIPAIAVCATIVALPSGSQDRRRTVGVSVLASLVHLTDLHLFLGADGRELHKKDRHRTVNWLSRLGLRDQLAPHNNEAWDELKEKLPLVLRQERTLIGTAPIAVINTGDVEAYGRSWIAPYDFLGYRALHKLRDEAADPDVLWFDLYGNHDIWFGRPPLMPHDAAETARNVVDGIRAIPGLEGPWPDHHPFLTAKASVQVDVHRVNTVPVSHVAQLAAHGRVVRHPQGPSPDEETSAALAELEAAIDRSVDVAHLRVLLMHHPAKKVPAAPKWHVPLSSGLTAVQTLMRSRTTGLLHGREDLLEACQRVPIHLAIAGHVHQLDPPPDTKPKAWDGAPVQLVAESPTAGSRASRWSFSIYRLVHDDTTGEATLTRAIVRYIEGGRAFLPPEDSEFVTIRAGIPLEHHAP